MIMLFTFIGFAFSQITHVDESNFRTVIDRRGKRPLFLQFWSQWCGHCAQVTPIFHQISENFSDSVEFAELNCDSNSKVCNEISDGSVPRFLFIDSEAGNGTFYTGKDLYEGFRSFLQKMLLHGVNEIHTDEELEKVIADSDYGCNFVFSLVENDVALKYMDNISNILKGSELKIHLRVVKDAAEREITVYKSRRESLRYNGNWTMDEIFEFVFKNRHPHLSLFSYSLLKSVIYSGKYLALMVVNSEEERYKLYDWELKSNPKIQYGFANENQIEMIAKSFALSKLKPPYIAVLDFSEEASWQNKDYDFSSESLERLVNLSLTDVLKKNVTRRNVNIFTKAYDWVDNYIEPVFALFIVGAIILLIVLIFFVFQIAIKNVNGKESSNKKEKTDDEKEKQITEKKEQ